MTQRYIFAPSTFALMQAAVPCTSDGGLRIPIVASRFCPEWGPEPTRIRRFVRARLLGHRRLWVQKFAAWWLRVERRQRVVYLLSAPLIQMRVNL
jgi:hypothetical protein